MIRRFLTRLAARWLSNVAHERRESSRGAVRAKARQIRAERGLPELEILK